MGGGGRGEGEERGGGGERLGQRNDALTTCKAINPRAGQRSFKGGGMFSQDFNFGFERGVIVSRNPYTFSSSKSIIRVVSVKALIVFACLIILLWEIASKLDVNVNIYTFPALNKFCSIEIAFRERQISSFILICWFIVSEVDRAIRMLFN